MPEEPLHKPHDKLFKSAFSDPVTAAGFLRLEIPDALSAAIDWDSLSLEPGRFVDSQYRQSGRLSKLLDEVVWDESLFLRVPPEIVELCSDTSLRKN